VGCQTADYQEEFSTTDLDESEDLGRSRMRWFRFGMRRNVETDDSSEHLVSVMIHRLR
jgi:hypothetical protein